MNLERRVAQLEAHAMDLRDRVDLVITAEEADAMLETLFMPEFQARRERLPAGVRWSAPTPEGAEQVLCDTIDEGEDVEHRRQERIAIADAVLTRMGV